MRLHRHVHKGRQGHGGFEGRGARFYDFVASRLLRRVYRRLAHDIAPLAAPGAAVLDVGTGPGVLLVELARIRPDLRLAGVDPSPDMVTAAQRKLGREGGQATVVSGEAANLPFEDASFDLVVSSMSLHHWQQPGDATAELARVLRPEGVVCVYDFPGAPFQELIPPDRSAQWSKVRPGIPFAPALTRVTYSA